jgi:hypothetical protein
LDIKDGKKRRKGKTRKKRVITIRNIRLEIQEQKPSFSKAL